MPASRATYGRRDLPGAARRELSGFAVVESGFPLSSGFAFSSGLPFSSGLALSSGLPLSSGLALSSGFAGFADVSAGASGWTGSGARRVGTAIGLMPPALPRSLLPTPLLDRAVSVAGVAG